MACVTVARRFHWPSENSLVTMIDKHNFFHRFTFLTFARRVAWLNVLNQLSHTTTKNRLKEVNKDAEKSVCRASH